MNVVAWILQIFLALGFTAHFVLYTISPEAMVSGMRKQGQWPPPIPDKLRRFIGIAELAGALGLILPAVTHVLPWLVPLAALCLAIVTILATIYHLRRKEPPIPAVIAVLCLILFYLRWQVVPLS